MNFGKNELEILLHISYKCLTDFVHPRGLQRSAGTYFPYLTHRVIALQQYNHQGKQQNSNLIAKVLLCIIAEQLYNSAIATYNHKGGTHTFYCYSAIMAILLLYTISPLTKGLLFCYSAKGYCYLTRMAVARLHNSIIALLRQIAKDLLKIEGK